MGKISFHCSICLVQYKRVLQAVRDCFVFFHCIYWSCFHRLRGLTTKNKYDRFMDLVTGSFFDGSLENLDSNFPIWSDIYSSLINIKFTRNFQCSFLASGAKCHLQKYYFVWFAIICYQNIYYQRKASDFCPGSIIYQCIFSLHFTQCYLDSQAPQMNFIVSLLMKPRYFCCILFSEISTLVQFGNALEVFPLR